MSRPMWFVAMVRKTFPQRFATAKLTRVPLLGRLLEYMLFEGDDIMILPQENLIHVDEDLEDMEQVVLPSQVLEHFIDEANHHWIMDRCICRDSMQCEEYPIDIGCLFMGEAALGINPKLGRPATREEALEHVRRAREAGLFHLIGRNKIDTVWLGVGPGDRLLTVCNCCTCCCLWRFLPDIADKISDKITRMPGVTVKVTDDCVGCGECSSGICLADAIHVEGGRSVISKECRGCGRCVEVCPQGAIEISIDDQEYVRKSIERITPLVDIT